MNTDNTLWKGRSSSKKQSITLFLLFVLTIALFVGGILASKKGNNILMAVTIVCFVLSIVPWVVLLVLIKRSTLKWESNGLIFNVTENGIYVTCPNNEGVFLFVEWAKIAGYSIKQGKKDKANVIVNFSCSVYGGILGDVKFLKMAGVTGVEELYNIFEKFGINNMELSKN